MGEQKEFIFENWDGINSKTSTLVKDKAVITEGSNVVISSLRGVISKVGGYDKIESAQTQMSGVPMGLFFAPLAVNSNQLLAYTTTNIYKYSASDFTSIKSGLTGGYTGMFSSDVASDDTASPFTELIVITNGVDNIQKWDILASPSATTDLGGSPPKAKIVVWWKRRVFTLYTTEGTDVYPNRVYWSALGDPEYWDTVTYGPSGTRAGYVDLDLNEGEVIVAAKPFLGTLVVLCSKSIVLLDYTGGSAIVTQRRLPIAFGCAAQQAVVVVNNALYYMSLTGVVMFNGSSVALVTEQKWDTKNINFDEIKTCTAGHNIQSKDILFSFVSDAAAGTVHDKTIMYNYITGTIGVLDFPIVAFENYALGSSPTWDDISESWDSIDLTWDQLGSLSGTIIAIGLDSNGYVQKLFSLNSEFDGDAISADFTTGWVNMQSFIFNKRLRKIYFIVTGSVATISVDIFTDLNSTTAAESFTISSDTNEKISAVTKDLLVNFKHIKFKISNNTINETFNIHSVVFEYSLEQGTR